MASSSLADLLGLSAASSGGGSDLGLFRNEIAANDVYRQIAGPLLSFKPVTSAIIPGTDGLSPKAFSMSPGASFLSSFLPSLLGGLSLDYGQQQEANQVSAVSKILPQLIASPGSVDAPDGVDPQAFNDLKLSKTEQAAARDVALKDAVQKAAANEIITHPTSLLLSKHFGVDLPALAGMDSTATTSPTTGAATDTGLGANASTDKYLQALIDNGGDAAAARQQIAKEKISQQTLQGLSNSLAVLKQLEELKNKPHTLTTNYLPDFVEGAVNDIASKVNPGSSSATYNSAVIPLTDSLLRALTQVGRGSQYNLQKIMDDLSEGFGKGPDALAARISNYQQDLLAGAQQRANDLVQSGVINGADPILQQILGLNLGDLGSSVKLGGLATDNNISGIGGGTDIKAAALAELKRRGKL